MVGVVVVVCPNMLLAFFFSFWFTLFAVFFFSVWLSCGVLLTPQAVESTKANVCAHDGHTSHIPPADPPAITLIPVLAAKDFDATQWVREIHTSGRVPNTSYGAQRRRLAQLLPHMNVDCLPDWWW